MWSSKCLFSLLLFISLHLYLYSSLLISSPLFSSSVLLLCVLLCFRCLCCCVFVVCVLLGWLVLLCCRCLSLWSWLWLWCMGVTRWKNCVRPKRLRVYVQTSPCVPAPRAHVEHINLTIYLPTCTCAYTYTYMITRIIKDTTTVGMDAWCVWPEDGQTDATTTTPTPTHHHTPLHSTHHPQNKTSGTLV